ncbi:MAG: NADPH:quinone reductase-like Zn-dependent oxidoreductase [Candidatus Azotimanducaceae bacterium]|jgi:NADPH:quinone reductase-like Zn-dependent oxidoreductase
MTDTSKEIRSEVTSAGKLKLSIESVPMPVPGDNEVLIKIDASPINPSDLGLLIGPADVSTMTVTGSGEDAVVTMDIPAAMMKAMAARVDESLPVGNEGAGVVIATGAGAEALMGKMVGVAGGAMYSQYRVVPATSCLVMHDGTTAAQAASCFVNPLTALGMVETMKLENHTALVHTAAASNLGQMLVKICKADSVALVNIVRKSDHVDLLKSLGAEHVCNSSSETFMDDLVDALVATGATLAFDATGGGKLAGQILTAMEIAANKTAKEYSRYGSTVHKQVYIYGGLDRSPTTLNRAFGMMWGIGGWLLTPFIGRIGMEKFGVLRQRVSDEIGTTFASTYTSTVSLAEVLDPEAIKVYAKQATGEKYLINPNG